MFIKLKLQKHTLSLIIFIKIQYLMYYNIDTFVENELGANWCKHIINLYQYS